MVGDDEYELVEKHELEELKEEVARLKKNPLKDYESSVTLIEAMDRLAGEVGKLVRIFEEANKEMHEEYSEGFHEEAAKLDKLIRQNEKIAKGVLAVADLVQDGSSGKPDQGRYPLNDRRSQQQPSPQKNPKPQQQSTPPPNQARQDEDLPPPPSFNQNDNDSGKRRDLMDSFSS